MPWLRPSRTFTVLLIRLILWIAVWTSATAVFARTPDAEVRWATRGGLHAISIEMKEATVLVHLPADLRSGDPVSGAVTVFLVGSNDKQRARAARRLDQLTLKLGSVELPWETAVFRGATVCGRLSCDSPSELGAPAVPMRVQDRKGELVAEAWLPLLASPDPAPEAYLYRPVGIVEQPVEIRGTFDGDSHTTRVEIGGRPARILAESPRHTFAVVPEQAVGPGHLTLREDGLVRSGAFRGLAVSLGAGKPVLREGERTTLTLRILGLNELGEELPVQLVSQQPSQVLLEAGRVQTLYVHPTELQTGGVYQWIGTVEGSGGGPVDIVLSTLHSRPEQRLVPMPSPESRSSPATAKPSAPRGASGPNRTKRDPQPSARHR